jgi:hypothetical protein
MKRHFLRYRGFKSGCNATYLCGGIIDAGGRFMVT